MRRLWVIVLGAVAPLLDSTIVTVALHHLSLSWHTSLPTIQWVMTAYLLAMALAMPLTNWASNRFGAKRMWIAGLTLFIGGSVLAGLSWSVGALIAFRIVQGMGGGFMMPIMTNLMVQSVDRRQLGPLMAIVSLPAVIIPIFGPVIGGLIVSHLSWRWIFYVNVPICVPAIILAVKIFPRSLARPRPSALDGWGLVWLAPALAGILFGLSAMGSHTSWLQAPIIVPLAIGFVCLGIYSIHALRTTKDPLIDLRLLRIRSFTASSLLLYLSGVALYGSLLVVPLYYQDIRHQTALMAGILLAPQGLGSLLPRTFVGKTVERVGIRTWVLVGVLAAALGSVPFGQVGPHTSEWLLAGSLVLRGAGLTAITIAVMVGAYRDVPPISVPSASSMTRILQQVGGAFGAAVLALILARSLHTLAPLDAARGYGRAMWWSIGFLGIMLVPAWWLPGRSQSQ